MYRFHDTRSTSIAATPEALFAHLDNHRRLSVHMTRPSAMMAGARMQVVFDALDAREVGARITLDGKVLGLRLRVEEIVTERVPPQRKTWETVGTPRLLVIGRYRMGFEITPIENAKSRLTVFLDYDPPPQLPARWLGWLLGATYAYWCVRRMVRDAEAAFAAAEPA